MGQLIKLQDHISRYETDIFHYPGQFIRLKNDRYKRLKEQWQEQLSEPPVTDELESIEKKSFFRKLRSQKVEPEELEPTVELPETESELKHWFLDQLIDFQLRWASGTIQEISYPDSSLQEDEQLKYFLQRFPDSYLLMYQPLFQIKKAIIDGGILFITPLEILCISFLDSVDSSAIYEPLDERRWLKKTENTEKTILNPMLQLNRVEKMVRSLLDYHDIQFPVKKTLITKKASIHSIQAHLNTDFIDKHIYDQWFMKHRTGRTPLKYQQLKVAEALLSHTQTTSFKRPEWDEPDNDFMQHPGD
ncbi:MULTISPECIES: NERD domain-containing protein [Allobacillus]|uniref:NERD domain-containing protein n=1 Tax=Allobacillus halotolerans TaxID=570278 RepID=A0ABS6GMG0_9BACI|nr:MULTISPECIES: NERD domain-containing protein [Allobacillus]MBU6080278.1 NERD domain-containing protein [Allobacillus halotolerans]TSJ68480.1 NERD domain-containing protein [Allobacillus sp. SKP2-8]